MVLDHFYAVCTHEEGTWSEKLSFDIKNGPFFSLPKDKWDLKLHTELYQQFDSMKISKGCKRSLKNKLYTSDGVSKFLITFF